jgi:hypothetical protein
MRQVGECNRGCGKRIKPPVGGLIEFEMLGRIIPLDLLETEP